MTLTFSRGYLLIGVTFLVCNVSARILDGRSKRALPPAWTQIANNDKCLANFKASASHSEKCIPLKPLTTCPIQTWDQLRDALTEGDPGEKKKAREAPSIQPPGKVGLGSPAYLSVPNFQQCLGALQRHGESHTSYCLPDLKPEGCQYESWERLLDKAVFQGSSCTENSQVGLGPPVYLSVSGHQGCLGRRQKPGESHTSLCLPVVKPEECPPDSWEKLQDKTVFDGDDCAENGPTNKNIGLGAPGYLSVPGFRQCLGEHIKQNDSHTSLCLPGFKPVECPVGSWQQLQDRKVFSGDECMTGPKNEDPQQVSVGAPAYLSVTGFQQCLLELQKLGEPHTSYCLPETKPENCLEDSWQKLRDENVFNGEDCSQSPDEPIQSGPPEYLSVPGFHLCLGEYQKESESHLTFCLPAARPVECPLDSWQKLQDKSIFNGNDCLENVREARQIRAGPPAYLSVPKFQQCLQKHQKPGDIHITLCLPRSKSVECPLESWIKLHDKSIFQGGNCMGKQTAVVKKVKHNRLGPPSYLSVPSFQQCLYQQQNGNSHITLCLPSNKPEKCPLESWRKLQDKGIFRGDDCVRNVRVARQIGQGAPAYLLIQNFQQCLGKHQKPGNSHTTLCLPRDKPAECPHDSWIKLQDKAIFTGDKCEEAELAKLGDSPHLFEPEFELCLSQNQMEKCLPYIKPDHCAQEMWDKLVDKFPGSSCPQDVNALPPPYLYVQGHENCLATQSASASHAERCLPKEKPQNCPAQAWESLQANFEGNGCRQSIASTTATLDFSSIQGHQACLKKYEASENHEDVCLPISKPNDCSQGAYEVLQSFAFKAHLASPSARTGKDLLIAGLDQCLGTHTNSDGHVEKCIPDIKPDGCTDEAFATLLEAFNGVQCRQGRDDHVKFPERPSGDKVTRHDRSRSWPLQGHFW